MTHLSTQRLLLRPFVSADAHAIVAGLNDMEMCYGLTVVPCPYGLADAEWFINEGSKEALAVTLLDGSLIGAMGLGKMLGYWIAKPHWGKGYATEAATAVLTRHFRSYETPVKSGYVSDNLGSAKVLKKLGFEVVGDGTLYIRSRKAEVPAKEVILTKENWQARS